MKITNNNQIKNTVKFSGFCKKNNNFILCANNDFRKLLPVKSDFYAKYNNIDIKPKIDFEKLKALNITNLQIVENKGVRGESLSADRNYKFLGKIKECGINQIIDLRTADYTEKFAKKCKNFGLKYTHIPIDSKKTSPREILDSLPKLFNLLNNGNYYIACAQGRHRTDIAFAMNYLFNPKVKEVPKMYGHVKDGKMRYEDIFARANSIMKIMTPEDKQTLGWTKEFELGFKERKQNLIKFNEQ